MIEDMSGDPGKISESARKAAEALERMEERFAAKEPEPASPNADINALTAQLKEQIAKQDKENEIPSEPQVFRGIVLVEDDDGNFSAEPFPKDQPVDPMGVYSLCLQGAEMMRQQMSARLMAQTLKGLMQGPAIQTPGGRRVRRG